MLKRIGFVVISSAVISTLLVSSIAFACPTNGSSYSPDNESPFDNLRCQTYSSSSAEVLWDNHLSGVVIGGRSAGGTSHYMTNNDFSFKRRLAVHVRNSQGIYFRGYVECPAR